MSFMTKLSKIAKPTMIGMIAILGASAAQTTSANAQGYDAGYYAFVQDVAYWDRLNIRKWPASYSQKVSSIPDNGWGIWVERCIIVEDASDWCKVKYADQWGWVNSRYLQEYQY
ncbi:MAG: SH3 domain-containing protein [Lentilitoribacter sp.]